MRYLSALVLAGLILAGSLPSSTLFAAQHGRPATGGAGRGDVQRDRLHDHDRLHDRVRMQDRDTIYGSQLMTSSERSTYRAKMRSLKTEQEREALRTQHHEEMQQRAQERGVKLPDRLPAQGARGGMGQDPATTEPGREQTEQETRERTQQGTPSSSGQGTPTREQTEQEQRERSSDDQSDGH